MNAVTAAPASKQSLSAEQWAVAALDALASGGLEAVAVEPLARALGVTKGSFYWHFANRDALLQAALMLWEQRESAAVIARAEREATPLERMLALFRELANTDVRTEKLLLALSGSGHPLVRASAQRVSARWRGYVEDCYLALGYTPQEAAHWATFAFCIFMGTVRMRRDDPAALPEGGQFNDYLRFLIRTLLPKSRQNLAGGSHPDPMRAAPHASSAPGGATDLVGLD